MADVKFNERTVGHCGDVIIFIKNGKLAGKTDELTLFEQHKRFDIVDEWHQIKGLLQRTVGIFIQQESVFSSIEIVGCCITNYTDNYVDDVVSKFMFLEFTIEKIIKTAEKR